MAPRDVIVLSKENVTEPPANWWVSGNSHKGVGVSPDHRPDSQGVQSATLTSDSKDKIGLLSYMDVYGKYLVVSGQWRLSFWAKGEGKDAKLEVSFKRMNNKLPYLSEEVALTPEWKLYEFNFDAKNEGIAGYLSLEFALAPKEGTKVYLDDVWLGSMADNSNLIFRKEVVELLKELRPSYLRDWMGQSDDSFANRIAPPYARKSYAYTPANGVNNGTLNWSYSIPEFLDLCEAVGANPWIVIPVVLSDEEYKSLGGYLAQNASSQRFKNVIIEFGNENWNAAWMSSGFPDPEIHGKVVERAWKLIGSEAGSNLTKTINGEQTEPSLTLQYASNAPSSDMVAVSGYYLTRLEPGANPVTAIQSLFTTISFPLKETLTGLKDMKKPLSIYAMNADTILGKSTGPLRNNLVSGEVSGPALAKHILECLFLNIQPDMIYTFSELKTYTLDVNDFVNLYGITVDLSPTLRFRPTGLAVKMLNRVITGSLHKVKKKMFTTFEEYTIGAFKRSDGWSLAIVSDNSNPQQLTIIFPDDYTALPSKLWTLTSANITDTNEDAENVKIDEKAINSDNRSVTFTIPPYGLIVAF